MEKQASRSPFLKYMLLEAPGWAIAALVLWFFAWRGDLSTWLAFLLFGLWVAKDFVLYPVFRIAYEDGPENGVDHLVGELGTARERLDPDGYVRIGSELWRAVVVRDRGPVEAGQEVRVVEVRNLTLRVEPAT